MKTCSTAGFELRWHSAQLKYTRDQMLCIWISTSWAKSGNGEKMQLLIWIFSSENFKLCGGIFWGETSDFFDFLVFFRFSKEKEKVLADAATAAFFHSKNFHNRKDFCDSFRSFHVCFLDLSRVLPAGCVKVTKYQWKKTKRQRSITCFWNSYLPITNYSYKIWKSTKNEPV